MLFPKHAFAWWGSDWDVIENWVHGIDVAVGSAGLRDRENSRCLKTYPQQQHIVKCPLVTTTPRKTTIFLWQACQKHVVTLHSWIATYKKHSVKLQSQACDFRHPIRSSLQSNPKPSESVQKMLQILLPFVSLNAPDNEVKIDETHLWSGSGKGYGHNSKTISEIWPPEALSGGFSPTR